MEILRETLINGVLKMNRIKNIVAVLLLLTLTGCAPMVFLGGAAAGVGGYKYYEGALVLIYKAPFEKTYESSVKAIEALGYSITERHQKIGSGSIEATDSNAEKVTIKLEYISAEETEVKIRIGLMGDEAASRVIKDKIADIVFDQENKPETE
jgi:uncharacterized lipoprotein